MPKADGWLELRPRPALHGSVLLGALMTALPAWMLLSGGSQRADAAEQNMWAAALVIGFGAMTIYLAWITYGVRIRFRSGELRVRSLFWSQVYGFHDILASRKSALTDEYVVTLRGGRKLRFSEYFSGVAELEESLLQHGITLF